MLLKKSFLKFFCRRRPRTSITICAILQMRERQFDSAKLLARAQSKSAKVLSDVFVLAFFSNDDGRRKFLSNFVSSCSRSQRQIEMRER